MVYASDYITDAAYRTALIKEFNTVGDLHLTRAQYQLERECQLKDTFTILQQYQQSTGTLLIDNQYFGFEEYLPTAAIRPFIIQNGYFTTIASPPSTAIVGSTVTVSVGKATSYAFANLNVSLKIFSEGNLVSELVSVANSNSVAAFTFTMPTGIGPVTLQSIFTDVPSNKVFALYSNEVIQQPNELFELDVKPFNLYPTGVSTLLAIGDYNEDGNLGTPDLLVGIGLYGTPNRLSARNHIEIRLDQDYYHPGIPGSSVSIQMVPAGPRSLARLKYSLYLYDYDQNPAGQYLIKDKSTDDTHVFNDLNVGLSGNLFILATVYNVWNDLILVPMAGDELVMSSNKSIAEPGESFQLSWNQPGPIYLKSGSFQINAPFLPFPVTKTFTGTTQFTHLLNIPSNFDQNAYISTAWITQEWANKIILGYDEDNTTSDITITASGEWYPLDAGKNFTVTVSVTPPALLSDYNYSITVYQGNNASGTVVETIENPSGSVQTSSFTYIFNTATLGGGTPYFGSYFIEVFAELI